MIHSSFPRYTSFDPLVPVWCITPTEQGCTHRFFDSSPISPSGRYVALFQLPFEDRQPRPGEIGHVRLVDLQSGESRVVAESRGWEPQLGANINWGATDNVLFFNDMDVNTWRPFAWKLDPLSGSRERMDGTVYHASLDGNWLISANLPLLRKTQAGYGVVVPKDSVHRNLGSDIASDGFYLTDTSTGQQSLLISLDALMKHVKPQRFYEDVKDCEVYGAHAKFNPRGTRLLLCVRWFRDRGTDTWEMSEIDYRALHIAWFTMSPSGGSVHCAIGPEQFVKGGHHVNWFPDGDSISLNLRLDGTSMRFVSVNYDGSGMQEIVRHVRGSGHPTVHPSGYILTDTYLKGWDFPQYGDGTVPLRWVDTKTGKECVLVRIRTQQLCADPALRIDPHPAWDRSWRYIVFNGFHDGTRRVFLADMEPLLTGDVAPTMRKRKEGTNRVLKWSRRTAGRLRKWFVGAD